MRVSRLSVTMIGCLSVYEIKYLENKLKTNKKIFPILMILGAGILLFRTILLLFFENGLHSLMIWVIVLTFIEMIIDLTCITFSFKWFLNNQKNNIIKSLRLGASAAIFHASRVLIYIIGRIGPWKDFDIKPDFRATNPVNIFWIYFAAILSILGIIGVFIIWFFRKKRFLQQSEG